MTAFSASQDQIQMSNKQHNWKGSSSTKWLKRDAANDRGCSNTTTPQEQLDQTMSPGYTKMLATTIKATFLRDVVEKKKLNSKTNCSSVP